MLSSEKDLGNAAVPKSVFASKSERGLLVVIGGSRGYHGAPALAALSAQNMLAALRTGAGYVVAYIPRSVASVVRSQTPAIIVNELGTSSVTFNRHVATAITKADAVVIGMAIGRERNALRAAARIIDLCSALQKKIVIDADAIRAIPFARKGPDTNSVITPQDREFEFVSGKKLGKDLDERIDSAVKLSRKIHTNVLLKGHDTVITDGKRIKINRSRSMSLATMGTGDVLSGIIGGYCATGASTYDAAVAGAYLHSRIGEMLFRKMGNHIISTDVVDGIPQILKRFDKVSR